MSMVRGFPPPARGRLKKIAGKYYAFFRRFAD